MDKLEEEFKKIDNIEYENSKKVLNAFKECNVTFEDFNSSNGYGISEKGRDKVEEVFAKVFNCDSSLVRSQIISGTHALTIALFGLLRPDDELLYITGIPYDTLQTVIGINSKKDIGSLKDYGISFSKIDLIQNENKVEFDIEKIEKKIKEDKKIKVIAIQRSCGYEMRDAITISQIKDVIEKIKQLREDITIMVDNCYGEFVEEKEPTDVGADIIVGSLMKNLGAGIAQTGGYIAGKERLIEKISYRYSSPGIGKEIGPSLGQNSNFLKGLYFAPSVVGSALKTMVYAAYKLEEKGYSTYPKYNDKRSDIVQKIVLGSAEKLVKFCQGIQSSSPIDSNVIPIPDEMGGYSDKIIMASGTFTQGSTIELSCDGPLREPYIAYMQGSLTFDYGKLSIDNAIKHMEE